MTSPLFTIFLPSYNGGDYLKQCVQSVLQQQYKNFELVILDDGSTDGSLQWLATIKDSRLRVLESSHLGIVENWRRSLEIDKAPWMTFIGQDDLLDPDYLTVIHTLIQQDPDADIYHTRFRYIDASGALMKHSRPLPQIESAAEYIAALFGGARDTHGTGYMLRSSRYDEVGGIPDFEKLLFADDALWITMMRRNGKRASNKECFSCRAHSASVGNSASWREWQRSMSRYIAFLRHVAEEDSAFEAALNEHGFNYFSLWRDSFCRRALVERSKRNQRLKRAELDLIIGPIDNLAPPSSCQIVESRALKAHRTINSLWLLRQIYRLYIVCRYGKKHLEV